MRKSAWHYSAGSSETGSSRAIWTGAEIGRQEDFMKKVLCGITGMLALAFLAPHGARAQEPLLANIPFAFTAGTTTLPAGEYRVEKTAMDSAMLLIRGTENSASTFVISNATEANRPQTKSKLIFHRHGNRYFLSQVWVAGYSRGRELPPSTQEKEEAPLARNDKPEEVTIVARLVPPRP